MPRHYSFKREEGEAKIKLQLSNRSDYEETTNPDTKGLLEDAFAIGDCVTRQIEREHRRHNKRQASYLDGARRAEIHP